MKRVQPGKLFSVACSVLVLAGCEGFDVLSVGPEPADEVGLKSYQPQDVRAELRGLSNTELRQIEEEAMRQLEAHIKEPDIRQHVMDVMAPSSFGSIGSWADSVGIDLISTIYSARRLRNQAGRWIATGGGGAGENDAIR